MASSSRGARALIAAALLAVVGLTAWYGPFVRADSGSFTVVLFGIPLLCAAVALWAEQAGATLVAPAVVAALGVVSVAWSLLTGLGIGLVFLVPSLLLLAAALVSWADRQGRQTSVPSRN